MHFPFKIHLQTTQPSSSGQTQKKVNTKPFKKETAKESAFNPNLLNFFRENQAVLQDLLQEKKEEISGVEQPLASTSHINNLHISQALAVQRAGEIDVLFEKMITEVHFLNSSNDTKTLFFLNGEEFSNSPFYGSQILIEEFSTAPKMFNITFISSPQGSALFSQHMGHLAEQFKQKELPFSIHRLDVELLKEDPLWLRIERDNRDKEEQDT